LELNTTEIPVKAGDAAMKNRAAVKVIVDIREKNLDHDGTAWTLSLNSIRPQVISIFTF